MPGLGKDPNMGQGKSVSMLLYLTPVPAGTMLPVSTPDQCPQPQPCHPPIMCPPALTSGHPSSSIIFIITKIFQIFPVWRNQDGSSSLFASRYHKVSELHQ